MPRMLQTTVTGTFGYVCDKWPQVSIGFRCGFCIYCWLTGLFSWPDATAIRGDERPLW